MLVDTQQNAVVIPTAALQMGNEGHFVWVLNSDNKVSKHLVKPGIQDSQKVVIAAGLSAGDQVVTDGIDRLTEGAKSKSLRRTTPLFPMRKQRHADTAKKEPTPDAGVTSGQHRRTIAPVHSAPRRHYAADGRDFACRYYRLSLSANRRLT
jgi:multidrug efflux system membrane fusion protein